MEQEVEERERAVEEGGQEMYGDGGLGGPGGGQEGGGGQGSTRRGRLGIIRYVQCSQEVWTLR